MKLHEEGGITLLFVSSKVSENPRHIQNSTKVERVALYMWYEQSRTTDKLQHLGGGGGGSWGWVDVKNPRKNYQCSNKG
jgi:hypothetical protein